MNAAMSLQPGARVTIDGKLCVIVADAVSDHLPPPEQRVVVLGRDQGHFFYVAAETMRRARAEAPGVEVLGLWQLLSAARALPKQQGMTVIYFDEQRNGRYVWQGDTVIAGEIRNGKLMGTFGYAMDLRQATEIKTEGLALRMPKADIGARVDDDHASRKNLLCGIAGVVIVVAVSGTVGMKEWQAHDTRRQIIAQSEVLQEQITSLQEQYDIVRASHIGAWPEQRDALAWFLVLALRRIDFSVAATDLSQPEFGVISDIEHYRLPNLARLLPHARMTPRNDGKLHVQWRNAQAEL